MGDFFQNGTIATLHDFRSRTTEELEAELKIFSAYRPMEIVLPCAEFSLIIFFLVNYLV